MEALALFNVEPEHVLRFNHDLLNTVRPEVKHVCFMDDPFDCAVEIHAHDVIQIDEVVTYIKSLAGRAEFSIGTVAHIWTPAPVEFVW